MGPIGCPETSIRNYQSTLRKVSEERRSYSYHGGGMKVGRMLWADDMEWTSITNTNLCRM